MTLKTKGFYHSSQFDRSDQSGAPGRGKSILTIQELTKGGTVKSSHVVPRVFASTVPPSSALATTQKETAAPAGPRNGGNNLVKKRANTSNAEDRAKAPRLASLRFKGLFSDEGYFYGWEVAR
ncbi:hypothetical protein MAE02_51250 [Microvirga aerophila]|uniref:Uncharacterized protein n=1 Tax=Microvirga aerophila TaxID=670291 RepID=A0A512BZP0_9HYPH|nr:hypothetical protein MAE02_51250 [Microvirga aerophila]